MTLPRLSPTRLHRAAILPALALALACAAPAPAQEGPKRADDLPRLLSLKSDLVNLRVGPGRRFPIDWVYKRRGLPVLVVDSHDQWRRVRDHEDTLGWVHQSLLSARRTVLTVGGRHTMRRRPAPDETALLRVDPGVVAALRECEGDWCRVSLADETGWLPRDALWGTAPP